MLKCFTRIIENILIPCNNFLTWKNLTNIIYGYSFRYQHSLAHAHLKIPQSLCTHGFRPISYLYWKHLGLITYTLQGWPIQGELYCNTIQRRLYCIELLTFGKSKNCIGLYCLNVILNWIVLESFLSIFFYYQYSHNHW